VIAYKTKRKNGLLVITPIWYERGKVLRVMYLYLKEKDSFGLSAWTQDKTLEYYSKKEEKDGVYYL
jgi:hypothetical protein